MQPLSDPTRPTILVVDDDDIVRAMMCAELEAEDFAVIEAGDGEEALELCRTHRPDLLVCDVVMPLMDGFALCRALRAESDFAYVPILMATGLDDIPSIEQAYEAGATDFIFKPIKWLLLIQKIRYMLRAGRAFTELRQHQGKLVAAKQAAETASRAKTEFLAKMSHELRTPLNSIIGFSDIIRHATLGPVDEHYAEYATEIAASGTQLLSTINDILDLAKAEADTLALTEDDVSIQSLVAGAVEAVRPLAARGEVDLGTAAGPGLPSFYGDPTRLRQVLRNLLTNAVKFTPAKGSVRLTAGRAPDGDLLLRVVDSGIGMDPAHLAVALAPFGQVDGGLSRRFEGAGLGLSLTKRLVELHGGTLTIASQLGEGTTVVVRLPGDRFAEETALPALAS